MSWVSMFLVRCCIDLKLYSVEVVLMMILRLCCVCIMCLSCW